ncbi:MAG: CDP-glucose 4,6-dehydratase, partial [Gammaproteobacteria bacterium]
VVRNLAAAKPVKVRNPNAVRPWQHVLEPLAGYLMLAERLWKEGPAYAGAWNFGSRDEDARPVRWIVERLNELWGEQTPRWQSDTDEHPHEARYLKLDCSKAHAELGWRPRWDLERALAAVVEWSKAYRGGADMHQISLDQIENYGKEMRDSE